MTASPTAAIKAALSSDDLGEQIAALRADLSKLVDTLSGDVTKGLSRAGQQIERSGHDARTTATNTVLDHPLAAVGVAVGVGLLLGLVARKA